MRANGLAKMDARIEKDWQEAPFERINRQNERRLDYMRSVTSSPKATATSLASSNKRIHFVLYTLNFLGSRVPY